MTIKSELSTGFTVEELEIGVDTEDVTMEGPAISDLADQWERLGDAFAAGEQCPACMHYDAVWNFRTQRKERECSALDPSHCPAVNSRSIANAFRRQAE